MPSGAIRHATGPNGLRVARIQDPGDEEAASPPFGLFAPDGSLLSRYPDEDSAMAALDAADPPVVMPDEGSPEDTGNNGNNG
jgi:hypothetical protein